MCRFNLIMYYLIIIVQRPVCFLVRDKRDRMGRQVGRSWEEYRVGKLELGYSM